MVQTIDNISSQHHQFIPFEKCQYYTQTHRNLHKIVKATKMPYKLLSKSKNSMRRIHNIYRFVRWCVIVQCNLHFSDIFQPFIVIFLLLLCQSITCEMNRKSYLGVRVKHIHIDTIKLIKISHIIIIIIIVILLRVIKTKWILLHHPHAFLVLQAPLYFKRNISLTAWQNLNGIGATYIVDLCLR